VFSLDSPEKIDIGSIFSIDKPFSKSMFQQLEVFEEI
jgi:hypothetical protein